MPNDGNFAHQVQDEGVGMGVVEDMRRDLGASSAGHGACQVLACRESQGKYGGRDFNQGPILGACRPNWRSWFGKTFWAGDTEGQVSATVWCEMIRARLERGPGEEAVAAVVEGWVCWAWPWVSTEPLSWSPRRLMWLGAGKPCVGLASGQRAERRTPFQDRPRPIARRKGVSETALMWVDCKLRKQLKEVGRRYTSEVPALLVGGQESRSLAQSIPPLLNFGRRVLDAQAPPHRPQAGSARNEAARIRRLMGVAPPDEFKERACWQADSSGQVDVPRNRPPPEQPGMRPVPEAVVSTPKRVQAVGITSIRAADMGAADRPVDASPSMLWASAERQHCACGYRCLCLCLCLSFPCVCCGSG